ncbi:unnamed protein product [Didymodactylos carnosus]|uniref:Uncharacterized protein n=1 Tax=Didymodactylos carnosus TaxID=1234261 RepID=A0A816DAI8_9BILA|nr:unnamed protein product [Didymodactylos carnosus]CAF4531771.1 unnamed protein product [Didymodactylos carnosus]
MWEVDKLGIRDLFVNTITSNTAEGLNYVYKEMIQFHTISIDRVLMVMKLLCDFYVAETNRGMCGMGT